ncbi:MAG: HAMP domain-containing sensor histidine kinase [Verrucomicrobia bacterium]|nr:HAMP domain-containing sensor histidine kinase [Verrucomicrobiota bacterium]MDA1067586.1 HAMP domain-containing sensor histidine kinase [Verrucomicrobiota bacterium]
MSLPPVLTRGTTGIEFFTNSSASLVSNLPDPYLNGLPDPVFLLRRDGRILKANARALSWLNRQFNSQVEGYYLHQLIKAHEWQGCIGSIEGKLLSHFFGTGILPRNVNLHLGIQGECEYMDHEDHSHVLKVSLKKIFSENQTQLMLTIEEITEAKKKELLQNLFMHDLANRVTEVIANSELLNQFCKKGENEPEKLTRWTENISMISRELGLEVSAQQAVASMEMKKMSAKPTEVNALTEVEKLAAHFYPVEKDHGVKLEISEDATEIILFTDPVLLRRVLTNLVKNAIEASKPGQVITLGCRLGKRSGQVEFWIHNPGYIEEEIRAHLFKPYFSTKNSMRGLGTYSIKFLTEFFLKGTVEVQSSKEAGTCFKVTYPVSLETKLSA